MCTPAARQPDTATLGRTGFTIVAKPQFSLTTDAQFCSHRCQQWEYMFELVIDSWHCGDLPWAGRFSGGGEGVSVTAVVILVTGTQNGYLTPVLHRCPCFKCYRRLNYLHFCTACCTSSSLPFTSVHQPPKKSTFSRPATQRMMRTAKKSSKLRSSRWCQTVPSVCFHPWTS